MGNLYCVYIRQTCNVYKEALFGMHKNLKSKKSIETIGEYHIVLAESEAAAKERYEQLYPVDPQYVVGHMYARLPDGWLFSKLIIDDYVNILDVAKPQNIYCDVTIDTLRKNMNPEDFLKYCRQIMYPIEKIIAE